MRDEMHELICNIGDARSGILDRRRLRARNHMLRRAQAGTAEQILMNLDTRFRGSTCQRRQMPVPAWRRSTGEGVTDPP